MTTLSKVNNVRQSKRLRDLYRRREQVAQAIRSLEQIQSMRSRRSPSVLPSLLELDRNLSASLYHWAQPVTAGQTSVQEKLAA